MVSRHLKFPTRVATGDHSGFLEIIGTPLIIHGIIKVFFFFSLDTGVTTITVFQIKYKLPTIINNV